MNAYLILRFDAPLMSFGAPLVDAIGRTERFVGRSMIAGLLANALGLDHANHQRTQHLQDRLRIACRCDRKGSALGDYQTVDLGQPFLLAVNAAWTTWGRLDPRRGGKEVREGTHIRQRHYIADCVYTVAVGLAPDEDDGISVESLAAALEEPARPLFLGRKPCIPSSPLLLEVLEARSPLAALVKVGPIERSRSSEPSQGVAAWWDRDDGGPEPAHFRELAITDERDWANQIHSGRRMIRHGLICLAEEGDHV